MFYAPWVKWIFRADGLTLWKWTFYAEKNPPLTLVTHEGIHLQQIKRDGPIKFYLKYFMDYLIMRRSGMPHVLAYRCIPYETEAYNHQDDPNYKVNV